KVRADKKMMFQFIETQLLNRPRLGFLTFEVANTIVLARVFTTSRVVPFDTYPFSLSPSHWTNISDCAGIRFIRKSLPSVKFRHDFTNVCYQLVSVVEEDL